MIADFRSKKLFFILDFIRKINWINCEDVSLLLFWTLTANLIICMGTEAFP